jgi:hypothetical protein
MLSREVRFELGGVELYNHSQIMRFPVRVPRHLVSVHGEGAVLGGAPSVLVDKRLEVLGKFLDGLEASIVHGEWSMRGTVGCMAGFVNLLDDCGFDGEWWPVLCEVRPLRLLCDVSSDDEFYEDELLWEGSLELVETGCLIEGLFGV